MQTLAQTTSNRLCRALKALHYVRLRAWNTIAHRPASSADVLVYRTRARFSVYCIAVSALAFLALQIQEMNEMSPDNNGSARRELDFWIGQYLEWHSENRWNASRYAVFLPVHAGFGDNVKGMVNLWAYSVLTRRVFLFHFVKPYPLTSVLSVNTTKQFAYHSNDPPNSSWVGNNVKYSYGDKLTATMRQLLRGNHRVVALHLSKAQPMEKITKILRAPYWKGVEIPPFTLNARRAVARILLQPSVQVQNTAFKFTKNWPRYIAVHARLGAGTGESKHHRFKAIQGRELQLAQCLVTRVAQLSHWYSPHIFVGTDTPTFRSVFESAVRNSLPHFTVHHVETNVTHYHSLNNRQAYIDTHVESVLLGNAEHIVAFNSGFPEVAFWRGTSKTYQELTYESCGILTSRANLKH